MFKQWLESCLARRSVWLGSCNHHEGAASSASKANQATSSAEVFQLSLGEEKIITWCSCVQLQGKKNNRIKITNNWKQIKNANLWWMRGYIQIQRLKSEDPVNFQHQVSPKKSSNVASLIVDVISSLTGKIAALYTV